MAKANAQDMADAMKLERFLGQVERGDYPDPVDHDYDKADLPDDWPMRFDENDTDHLRYFHEQVMKLIDRSSLTRVVFGFRVLMDNDVCDPASSTLDWHPDLAPAIAERAARKAKEKEAAHG
jgi:hypothetical protein